MTASIKSLALCAPVVASNAVFSVRRGSKGIDAFDKDPVYGAMNIDIAAGQTLKGTRAMATMNGANINQKTVEGAADTIKTVSKTNKVLSGLGKVVKFTADNINPIICVTSGVKVLNSDDKLDEGLREGGALTAMFAGEGFTKKFVGMPYTTKENGKVVNHSREALYRTNDICKKLHLDKQADAMKDYCATKKLFNKISLKGVPGVLKGLTFVGASIGSYQAGDAIMNSILGDRKQSA